MTSGAADLAREWWRPVAAASPASAAGRREHGALAFRALMAFTGMLIVAPQTLFPVLAPLRLPLLAALVAGAAHAHGSFSTGAPLLRPALTNKLALALLAWAVVTTPLSYWPGGSAALLADLYLKSLVVFWLVGGAVNDQARLRRLVTWLSVLMLPLALTAIRNYASGAFLSEHVVRRIAGYDAPLTQNPNDLALLLNLILPLSFGLLLASRNPLERVGLALLMASSVVAIVLTFSRAGFLCLALTVASYLVKLVRRGDMGWVALAALGAVLGIAFLPDGYAARLSTISDVNSDPTRSAQLRWADMVLSADYMLEHPLVGAGIGMNSLALNDLRGPAWKDVHNAYLQYGVDLGLPGLLMFVGLLACSIRDASAAVNRCRTKASARPLGTLAEGIRLGLVALAAAAFFHPIAYQFFFYYVAGLAVAVRSICERELPG